MSKQAESAVSKRIVDGLNARGHFVWKNHGSVYAVRGLADITGFSRGDGIGIYLETKRESEKYGLTYQQFLKLKTVREACPGARCGVVSGIEEAIQIIEQCVNQTVEWWRSITAMPEAGRRRGRAKRGGGLHDVNA